MATPLTNVGGILGWNFKTARSAPSSALASASGKATSPEQRKSDPKTFRLSGLSSDIKNSEDVSRLLTEWLGSECRPRVLSLASDPSSSESLLVSTVEFDGVFGLPSENGVDTWAWRARGSDITLDTNFRGITPLNSITEHQKTPIFLIAITGLGGHPFGSWKDRHGSFMWLRDHLPTRLPGVQVLLYGYKSFLPGSHSFQEIDDIARSFRESIRNILESRSACPVYFVAHSLGGIVLKHAIVQMQKSGVQADLDNLLSIYGILFFGVPHRGMEIKHLLAMVKDQPNQNLVKYLAPESRDLKRLHKDFWRTLNYEDSRPVILSFYETEESMVAQEVSPGVWQANGPYKILVPKASAINSHPLDSVDKALPIPRNHSDIVKFPNSRDYEYQLVLRHLEEFQPHSLSFIQKRFAERRKQTDVLQPLNELDWEEQFRAVRASGSKIWKDLVIGKFPKAPVMRALQNTRVLVIPSRQNSDLDADEEALGPQYKDMERWDNLIKRRPTELEDKNSQEEKKVVEGPVNRQAYHEEREVNMRVQEYIQRTRSELQSIRDLGTLNKYRHRAGPGEGFVIGALTTSDLKLRTYAKLSLPKGDPWDCHIQLQKDEDGILHTIISNRIDGVGRVSDTVPLGIGSIPHTDQIQDVDQLFYRVTFLHEHDFMVDTNSHRYPYKLEPIYDFRTVTDSEVFQSEVFGKVLKRTIGVRMIYSNIGEECATQNIRVWQARSGWTIQFHTNSRKPNDQRGYWEIPLDAVQPPKISRRPMKAKSHLRLYIKAARVAPVSWRRHSISMLWGGQESEPRLAYLDIEFEKDEDREDFLDVVATLFPKEQSPYLDASSSRPSSSSRSRSAGRMAGDGRAA